MSEVEAALEQIRGAIVQTTSKVPIARVEDAIRKAIEATGLSDDFEIVKDAPDHYSIKLKLKVPVNFITITLPEGVTLTDEEIEINSGYGDGP